MKLKLLFCALTSVNILCAQETLFEDNFESGPSKWILNSSDLGNPSTMNKWVINNTYTVTGNVNYVACGYAGHLNPVPVTTNQPTTISNSNQNYLHITSIGGDAEGKNNAHFIPNNSFCNVPGYHFVKMAEPISTIGKSNVELTFWKLIGNIDAAYHGAVHYSLDGGSTWQIVVNNINNVTNWTKEVVTHTAWENAPSLLIGFEFKNGIGYNGLGPSFSIDDVLITAQSTAPTIHLGAITTTPFCAGTDYAITVPFVVGGSIEQDNVYSVELSDGNGQFDNPTIIGSLTSYATGQLSINASIPASTPAATGYKIRVSASTPSAVSNISPTAITIHPTPTVTLEASESTICVGESVTITASGAQNYNWIPSTGLDNSNTNEVVATLNYTLTYYVTGTNEEGCESTSQITITVDDCLGISAINADDFVVSPNPTSGQLFIKSVNTAQLKSLKIVDLFGKIVREEVSTNSEINIADLENGVYYLILETATATSMQKIIKK